MIKNGAKIGFLLAMVIVACIAFAPAKAHAIDFNPFNPLDPFCLFTNCDKKPEVVNNTNSNNVTTNSNNTNSNINSGTITTAPASTGATTISASPQGAIYSTGTNPAPTIVNNNNSSATISNPNPVVVQQQTPLYYNQVYAQPIYTQPVYTQPTYYDYNRYFSPTYVNPNSYNTVYYSPLTVSCSANTTFAPTGTTVTWTAYPSGASGSYSYSWSGTDGMYGSYSSLSTYYNTPGVKYAYVTVYSNGQQTNVQCSNSVTVGSPTVYSYGNTQYVNSQIAYNPNLMKIACFSDKTTAGIGEPVTWNAEVTGSTGNYTYTWSGTENIFSFQPSAIAMYQKAGSKSAIVTVTSSNGTVQSKACGNSVTIKSNTVAVAKSATPVITAAQPTPAVQATIVTPTTMASLFSLQNVPWGLVGILVILVLLAVIFYLMFNKKKI